MLGPKPRLSRRRIISLGVLVLVAILLIAEVINDAEKQAPAVGRRLSSSWVAGVEPMLASSSAVASVIASIERNPSAQTISTTNASVTAADQILSTAQESMRALDLPAPSVAAARLASGVLADRVATVDSLRQLLVAAGLHQSGSAVGACLSLQNSVELGDAALVGLRSVLRSLQLSGFQMFRPWALVLPRLRAPGCTTLVNQLIADPALVARLGLHLAAISVESNAVQINGVPNPTSSTTTTTVKSNTTMTTSTTTTTTTVTNSGTTTASTTTSTTTTIPLVPTTTLQIPPAASHSVLPPTTTITVQVVVTNSGNQSLDGVQVRVQLLASTASQAPPVRDVGAMLPGSARDLRFGPIQLGKITGSFRLEVSATASNLVHTSSTITLVRSPH